MHDANYKPIPLTRGKTIDYRSLLQKTAVTNKTVQAQVHGPSEELAKFGIKGETKVTYRRDKNGNLMLDNNGRPITVQQFTPTEVPDWFTHAVMVLAGHEACYFDGCEEIVKSYKNELAILENRPGGCRECERAALKRKYAVHFQNALPPKDANKLAQPTVPPHKITNTKTQETTSVPRKPVAYASIRREIPDDLKKAFTIKVAERKLMINGEEVPIDGILQKAQIHTTGDGERPGEKSS